MKKILLSIIILVFVVGIVAFGLFQSSFYIQELAQNIDATLKNQGKENNGQTDEKMVAEGLKIPWEIVFLPPVRTGGAQAGLTNGRIMTTERQGNLAIVQEGQMTKRISVGGVYHIGEGGLLGMALHPDFLQNNFIYLYLTYKDGVEVKNRVERHVFLDNSLKDRKTIIEDIPGSENHNGGRIAFGPDKMLYITTGDASNSSLAQNTNSLAGKILRVTDDGQIPQDNPFGNAVFSYGHRNSQGLAFDDQGRLWATEHGRSGLASGFDEVNLIEKGKNYGWPEIQGDEQKTGMVSPVINSGADKTWAPAGIVFSNGMLFFAGLRGAALYQVKINGSNLQDFKENYSNKFGRIRAVSADSAGGIYFSTSNTDGRGIPSLKDDKIIQFVP